MNTQELTIKTRQSFEAIELTPTLVSMVENAGIENGFLHVFVRHTTAAIVLNENADKGLVWRDLEELLDTFAPADNSYHHSDGNGHAHLKALLLGCEKTLLIQHRRLILGTWQGVFLIELDGPRERSVLVSILKEC